MLPRRTGHEVLWYVPKPLRAHKPIWSFSMMFTAGILLVASVVAAFAYPPSRSLFWYLMATVAKSEATMLALGTVVTLILSAGIFLAAALVYFGYPVMGAIIGFALAIASIVTGGGFIAGLVLGIIGALLAILEK